MSNGTVTVDANSLRRAAEHADGYRERKLYLYYRANKLGNGDDRVGVVVHVSEDDAKKAGDKSLSIEVYTARKGEGMGHPDNVVIHYKGYTPSDVMACEFDSLFWTQSAVEKFLIPYYASIYDKGELELLRDASQKQTTLCFGHRFPTVYEPNPYCDGGGPPYPYRHQTNVLYIVLAEADEPQEKEDRQGEKRPKEDEKPLRLSVLPFQEYARRKLARA